LLPEQATWPSYSGTRCFIFRQIFQYYRSSNISQRNSKLENTETAQLTQFQVTEFETYKIFEKSSEFFFVGKKEE
jgi:hypothetical protein